MGEGVSVWRERVRLWPPERWILPHSPQVWPFFRPHPCPRCPLWFPCHLLPPFSFRRRLSCRRPGPRRRPRLSSSLATFLRDFSSLKSVLVPAAPLQAEGHSGDQLAQTGFFTLRAIHQRRLRDLLQFLQFATAEIAGVFVNWQAVALGRIFLKIMGRTLKIQDRTVWWVVQESNLRPTD